MDKLITYRQVTGGKTVSVYETENQHDAIELILSQLGGYHHVMFIEFNRLLQHASVNYDVIDGIALLAVDPSVAIRDTYEIFDGEMVPYLFDLYSSVVSSGINTVIIDSISELIGTNTIDKLLECANMHGVDIYTSISR